MEAAILASLLLHPVPLGCLGLVMFGAVLAAAEKGEEPARFSASQLLRGFGLLAVAAVLIAAVSAYAPPEAAASFGVQPEDYRSALKQQFIVTTAFTVYVAILGCAFVGLPVTLRLVAQGFGTVPFVLLASVPISIAATIGLGLLSGSQLKQVAAVGTQFVASHIVLALAFSVGLGLPWRKPAALRQ